MGKKSFLDKVTGKKTPAAVKSDEADVDHLWMKEDIDATPKSRKDPRIDTGILRGRIAGKIAKMNDD